MKNLIFIFILWFASSCATTEKTPSEKEIMDSWVNDTKVNLLASWGIPNKVSDDGKGGEILVFEKTAILPQTGVATLSYNNIYFQTNQNVVTRSRMFYVNENGIIYGWLCNGRRGY